MTDHPSNPPSQTKGQEIARRYMFAPSIRVAIASDIDAAQFAALAAQEARHKAANEKNDKALETLLDLKEEAESKLREATERIERLEDSMRAVQELSGDALAAIRSGSAQQAAEKKRERLHASTCTVPNAFFVDDRRCTCGLRDSVDAAFDHPARIADPAEQETPKPDRNHCEHGTPYVGPACGACFPSAPPAHGGGD